MPAEPIHSLVRFEFGVRFLNPIEDGGKTMVAGSLLPRQSLIQQFEGCTGVRAHAPLAVPVEFCKETRMLVHFP